MDEQFGHPSAVGLLDEVRDLFKSKSIFHKRDRPIVFLCGGAVEYGVQNMRREFLDWAGSRLPEFDIVLAENAYKHTLIYHPLDVLNLAEFEDLIASIADCVLLFPESAGSFAELGLFSGSAKVQKKMLVANDVDYQARESFINLGPIRTIDECADLRPTIQLVKRDGRFDFEPLKERLGRFVGRSRRKSFPYETYRRLEYLGKFLVVLEMVSIFEFVTLEGLYRCVRVVFDTAKRHELEQVLSVLTGAGYIRFKNEFYFLNPGKDSLLEFQGVQVEDIKARILQYYRRYRGALYNQFQSESA